MIVSITPILAGSLATALLDSALREPATQRGATQDQFSRMLGLEVELQTAKAAPAAPAAPARADTTPYADLSMSAKLARFGHV
jgi:hypothetical protein